MKKIFPLVALLLLAFTAAFSQSAIIKNRKVTYKRPKPITPYKKTFTVNYPKVSGIGPAISKKVETNISYAKVLDMNLKDEINDVQWLAEADYTVNYNKNGILDVKLWLDGSAAYPSVFSKTVVINLKTGNRVIPADVFTNLAKLANLCRAKQVTEIKKAKEDYKKDPDSADFDGEEYFKNAKFGIKELSEFTISDKGVTFMYDYGFPHVVLALQPDGEYFFSWKELKPYIRKDGLFGQFVG